MPFEVSHAPLAAALAARGYLEPTPVQAQVLAPEHTGRNLLVSARTGSGKTVAFGLCLANELLEGDALTRPIPSAPLGLVIAPTRELALQVRRELAWLWADARIASCVGGMDFRREAQMLSSGVHLVVGTPGRLCDHLTRGTLRLDAVRAVVLDEADEMLDLGFRDELERLLDATPTERRTLMFSATLPDGILSLAKRYQKDPVRIAAGATDEPHADIEHRAVMVAPREREHAIVNMLRFVDPPTALVFCATRDGVAHLHASLEERGFTAVALSGELSQTERSRALQSLRDGRARVLVATDVAARGLDLPDLQLVIHADLPHDAQVLLHRSGRTGRAGRKGTAVTLVVASRRRQADRLFREARLEPRWSSPPSGEDVKAKDRERAAAELDALLGEPGDEATEADALLTRHTPQAIAAALIRLHRKAWPEPEELPETEAFHARMSRPQREEAPRRERPVFRPEEHRPVFRPDEHRPAANPDERRPPEAERKVHFHERAGLGDAPRPNLLDPRDGGRRPLRRRDATEEALDAGGNWGPPQAAHGVWFRMNVGRAQNADPRWLIPLICRRGNVQKSDIGSIRVLDNETRFEVSSALAEQFFNAARKPDRQDPRIKIVPAR